MSTMKKLYLVAVCMMDFCNAVAKKSLGESLSGVHVQIQSLCQLHKRSRTQLGKVTAVEASPICGSSWDSILASRLTPTGGYGRFDASIGQRISQWVGDGRVA